MKFLYSIFFCAIILSACTKNAGDIKPPAPTDSLPSPVDNFGIPPATPVTANLGMYIDADSRGQFNIKAFNNYLQFNGKGFFSSSFITGDKYYSVVTAEPEQSFDSYELFGLKPTRILTFLSTTKNYGQIVIPRTVAVGSTNYDYGTATFNLPAGGTIFIPPSAYTPSQGGSVTFSLRAEYLDPSAVDLSLKLPTFCADNNGKRYFLNSFGTYLILLQASDNTGYGIDFKETAPVKLRMPIPASLLSSAPDSIPAWNFNNYKQDYKWKQYGYAKKNGNFYESVIHTKGYWNFALPVDGAYITLDLKTQTRNVLVPNTRFRINDGTKEVAQGRTDAEGKALVFLPKNRSLSLEYRNDHYYSWENSVTRHHVEDIGSFSTTFNKTVIIPNRYDLAILEGNAFNCDGSVLETGRAVISEQASYLGKDFYSAGIINGKFKFAQWIAPLNTFFYKVDMYSNTNSFLNSTLTNLYTYDGVRFDSTYLANPTVNYYACADANKVYCNYTIDDVRYSVTGDANATSPVVTCNFTHPVSVRDQVKINNNGNVISFIGDFPLDNNYSFLALQSLVVNNIGVTYDGAQQLNVLDFTRKDISPTGFMEGFFSLHYRDAANILHHIKGNFRARKT